MNASARKPSHLQLVAPPVAEALERPAVEQGAEPGDLVLLVVLLLVAAVPLGGELTGLSFGAGTLGASALLALLSGRELLTQVRALLRARASETP